MIDIETDVFSIVSSHIFAEYPSIVMVGEYVKVPPSFPAISLVEMDNAPVVSTQTSSDAENHVTVMYEVNVYSNKKTGKKSECKKLLSRINDTMQFLGFTRIMSQPIPNMDDATIYRMVARYKAVVSKNKTIYRR